jgi:hypothetical protein
MKQAQTSSPTSKVRSDIILSIPIASLVTVPNKNKTIYKIVNKFRQTGSLLDKNKPNKNPKCSMKRKWIKSMIGLNIPLRESGFKVSSLSYLQKGIPMNVNILWRCKE